MFNLSYKQIIFALVIILITEIFGLIQKIKMDVSLLLKLEELIVVCTSILLIYLLAKKLRTAEAELKCTKQQLQETQLYVEKQDKVLAVARKEYSKHINKQLEDWHLTQNEKSLVYLLLKGLSLKEISAIRKIKEKSVRQQASNLYNKVGLPGRHALSAWFFEDIIE